MTQPQEVSSEVMQRLGAISSTVDALRAELIEIHTTYLESNGKYTQALQTFRESDERYRKELEAYTEERQAKEVATKIGAVLRIVAVVLLSYIALKVS